MLLRAALPPEWTEHAPTAIVRAAATALDAPLGSGPLWESALDDDDEALQAADRSIK